MVNELKVYNCFGELTLHLRHSLGQHAELLTVDGTDDMRAAVAELRGNDFDRTIAKGGELVRLTANWGSEEYLPVLARYFGMNFGWRTQTIQTKEHASLVHEPSEVLVTRQLVSGNATIGGNATICGSVTIGGNAIINRNATISRDTIISGNATVVFTNVREYRPKSEPRIELNPVPVKQPESAIYGIPAN